MFFQAFKPSFCPECKDYIVTVKDEYKDEAQLLIERELEEGQEQAKGPTDMNPFVIEGMVFGEDEKMVKEGTVVRVTNMDTGQVFEEITGRGPVSGKYSLMVYGLRDDKYNIEVIEDGNKIKEKEITINDDTKLDLT